MWTVTVLIIFQHIFEIIVGVKIMSVITIIIGALCKILWCRSIVQTGIIIIIRYVSNDIMIESSGWDLITTKGFNLGNIYDLYFIRIDFSDHAWKHKPHFSIADSKISSVRTVRTAGISLGAGFCFCVFCNHSTFCIKIDDLGRRRSCHSNTFVFFN